MFPVSISPATYADMFRRGTRAPKPVAGVCGRVVRGRDPHDFERLSFTEGRRLAWVMGPEGMNDQIGKCGREIVLDIGKDAQWLQEKLAEGMRWKLVVLPQTSCRLADWDGLLAMIVDHYPEIAPKLMTWSKELRNPGVAAGIDKRAVAGEVKDDPLHPLHMTVERYRVAEDTPINARLFLWHSLGVNEKYTGEGYTAGTDGTQCSEEYLAPNCELASLPGVVLIDLTVL